MTTLIADSGSTKTNWLLISNNGKIEKYQTEGINPVVGDSTLISNTIGKSFAPYVEGTKKNNILRRRVYQFEKRRCRKSTLQILSRRGNRSGIRRTCSCTRSLRTQ